AMHSGADISVMSIHKLLTGLGQASIIHAQGKLVDMTRLSLAAGLLESTSASSVINAATDGCRRQMVLHGQELLDRTIGLCRHIQEQVASIPGISVMGQEVVGTPGVAELDPTKLTIDISGLGLTGF